jgi:hypothetical protein
MVAQVDEGYLRGSKEIVKKRQVERNVTRYKP